MIENYPKKRIENYPAHMAMAIVTFLYTYVYILKWNRFQGENSSSVSALIELGNSEIIMQTASVVVVMNVRLHT